MSQNSKAIPIILDTDIGNDPDDLLALAMVLDRVDLFDLRAVITTGKAPDVRARFVKYLCGLVSINIPIGTGIATELSKDPSEFHLNFFREFGLDLSSPNIFPNARDVLKNILSPEVTLITIGPLSTLADFIINHPSAMVDNVVQVVSMGGFISRKKNKHVKEYNFGCDRNATRIVLLKDFDISV